MEIFIINNGVSSIKCAMNTDYKNNIYKKEDDYITSHQNIIFRHKNIISFSQFPSSTTRTMFDTDIVTNLEVAEQTFDLLIDEHSKKREINLDNVIITENLYTPSMFKKEMIELWMETYNTKKLQIGFESVYTIGKKDKNVMIIKIGTCSTSLIILNDKKIKETFRIPLGKRDLENITNEFLNLKYGNVSKERKINNIKCIINYKSSTEKIKNKIKDDNSEYCIQLEERKEVNNEIKKEKDGIRKISKTKRPKVISKKEISKKTRKTVESEDSISETESKNITTEESTEEETNEESIEGESLHDDVEKDESKEEENFEQTVNEEEPIEIKEIPNDDNSLNVSKIGYFSAIYRMKIKIEKAMETFRNHIEMLEDEYKRLSDPEEYMKNLIIKHFELGKKLRKIDRTERNMRDRKSKESNVLFKRSINIELKNKDVEILDSIEAVERKEEILKEYDEMKEKILSLGGEVKEIENIFDYNLLYLDMCFIAELLFYPSLISVKQPGLVETIEMVTKRYNIEKVYLDGLVIDGFKERIEYEVLKENNKKCTFEQNLDCNKIFKECNEFSEIYKIYNKQDYEEMGIDKIRK